MMRRSLDSFFLPHFRQFLLDGFAIGPAMANVTDLTAGSLSVWVPQEIGVIPPEKLLMDIAPTPDLWTGISETIARDLALTLKGTGPWLLLGETYWSGSERPPLKDVTRFVWPIVPSAASGYDTFLCACSIENNIDEQNWVEFEKELKPYPPSIVLIAKPPHGLELKRGEFPVLEGEQLSNLLRSTEYILVGVFDDMSKMLWERKTKHINQTGISKLG